MRRPRKRAMRSRRAAVEKVGVDIAARHYDALRAESTRLDRSRVRRDSAGVDLVLAPALPDRVDALRAVLLDPSLAAEYGEILASHLDDQIADPYCARELTHVAWVDGAPAGFALTFVLPGADGVWSMTRLGVLAPFRRRGVGTALFAATQRGLDARGVRERLTSAWQPCPEAEAFVRGLGLAPERTFWQMRHDGAIEPPRVPDGVTVRGFDGSERDLAAWNDVYTASFASNWRFVAGTLDYARELARAQHFHPDGLLLAWRDGVCVGHCRCARFGDAHGEIAVLGVVPEARGIGLGRALLRGGVRWLAEHGVPRATLLVDGENESALALYAQEGFEVERTRSIWGRRVEPAASPS